MHMNLVRKENSMGKWGLKRTILRASRALRRRDGQSLVEYSLILALIAIVAITVLRGLGKHVNNTLSSINVDLP
jgi:Flp pilus assembly pilin Flp